jgi:hypothetical protein
MQPDCTWRIRVAASKGVNGLAPPWMREKADAAGFSLRKHRGDETRGLE